MEISLNEFRQEIFKDKTRFVRTYPNVSNLRDKYFFFTENVNGEYHTYKTSNNLLEKTLKEIVSKEGFTLKDYVFREKGLSFMCGVEKKIEEKTNWLDKHLKEVIEQAVHKAILTIRISYYLTDKLKKNMTLRNLFQQENFLEPDDSLNLFQLIDLIEENLRMNEDILYLNGIKEV